MCILDHQALQGPPDLLDLLIPMTASTVLKTMQGTMEVKKEIKEIRASAGFQESQELAPVLTFTPT